MHDHHTDQERKDAAVSRPKLAVVMPNYNHAKYLPEAIESVLAQTRLPDEFLILDDASTDNSVEVIERYARQHSIIRLIRGTANVGVNAAHKQLFELVKSDYVDPMAADDARFPRCYELAMAMAEGFPEAGIIFGKTVMTTEDAEVLSIWGATAWQEPLYADRARFIREYLEREPPSQGLSASTIFRLDAFREAGWYCDVLGPYGDTFTAHAIALQHGACYVPEPLARCKVFETSYSAKTRVDPRATIDIINRSAYLMSTPRFCESFPSYYVKRWRRRYIWQTVKEYWRCDYSGEFPPGSPVWVRYRHRIPRTFAALSLLCHRTDLSPVKS